MKKKEILVLIGELLGSRAVYSVASLVVTITMLSGITIILRNDIRDIKNYVQSVVAGDPNYKEIHSQVSGSENVIRGNIDFEAFLAKEDKKIEGANTDSNINSGYDNYTPTQTITDDYNNKPSNGLNNSNSGETTIANNNNNNNSNNNSNNSTNEVNNRNNNSDEDKKENVLDRSSFNGKDVMVSEGEPFNPMNALQLAATDINGKNITNKIVITENNVDTYKPGLYTVKATVELSDKSNLEKEFFVRVEPTVLSLSVNDVRTSKNILEKNEEFNLSFSVKSSKSYLEVASVNINNKDYIVNKTSYSSFFRKSNKYEVNLMAPSKGGAEKIQIKSVTMSDGTVVDVDKSVDIEVLRQEAQITDVVINNIYDENENIYLEYNLQDVDDTIEKAVLYLYNENNIIIQREELEKNNKSCIDLNINENGQYKVEVKGYYKENLDVISKLYKEKELFTQNLEVNKFNDGNIISDKNFEILDEENLMLMSTRYDEEEAVVNLVSADSDVKKRIANSKLIQSTNGEITQQVTITGSVNGEGDKPAPGTLSVTVPTALSFAVKNDGILQGTQITVENNGTQEINVYAYEFIDTTSGSKITVHSETESSLNKRSDIKLRINGNSGTAYFKSEDASKVQKNAGIYLVGGTKADGTDGILISNVSQGQRDNLKLTGEAGNQALDVADNDIGINDTFTLRLKIKKSEKN